MVDIIYKTECDQPEQAEKLPRNFRQIGTPDGSTRLYIEDYVATYLQQINEREEYETKLAVLFGQSKNTEAGMRVFISAAIAVDELGREGPTGEYYLSDHDMAQIYKDMKEYLTGVEMLGWTLTESCTNLELSVQIEKTQRKYFPGRGRVFWHRNHVEQEENLYVYERGVLNKQNGYYIYYEKNPQMREYMVSQKERTYPSVHREKVLDKVTEQYRQKMAPPEHKNRKTAWQLGIYTASMGVMAAVCIFGVTMISNYENMKEMEATLAAMTSMAAQKAESADADQDAAAQKTENETEPQETINTDQNVENPAVVQETDSPEQEESKGAVGQAEEQEVNHGGDAADEDNKDGISSTDAQGSEESTENPTNETNQAEQTAQIQDAANKAAAQPNENQIYLEQGYYIVKAGDRLADISVKLYNTDTMVTALCEKNQIEDIDKIYAGQKLLLP